MSKDEALKLALEALEKSDGFLYYWHESASDDEADAYATARQLNEQAITAIKEAREQPQQKPITWADYEPDGIHHNKPAQHPVAYIGMIDEDHFADVCRKANGNSNTLLYTSPPAQQEPVAWADLLKDAQQIVESKVLWKRFIDGTPLSNDIACWMADFAQQYTTPPQRKPLTDEETTNLWNDCIGDRDRIFEIRIAFARAIEAAHGIKTGGAV